MPLQLPTSRRPRSVYTPRLECLEDRCVPTATVTQSGNQIVITGDNTNDTIIITDNGGTAAGAIVIQGTVVGQTTSLALAAGAGFGITINTAGGRDTVIYNLTGGVSTNNNPGRPTAGRSLFAMLGPDDDIFRFTATHDAVFSTSPNGLVPMAIGNGARVALDVQGNAGDDVITFRYLGLLGGLNGEGVPMGAPGGNDQGFLRLVGFGGNGDDRVVVDVSPHTQLQGTVQALALGGNGDDFLFVNAQNTPGFPLIVSAILDGGAGFDEGFGTPNSVVTSVNPVFTL